MEKSNLWNFILIYSVSSGIFSGAVHSNMIEYHTIFMAIVGAIFGVTLNAIYKVPVNLKFIWYVIVSAFLSMSISLSLIAI